MTHPAGATTSLKSVDEHLDDLLTMVGPLAPFELQVLDAHGCILAEDVHAEVDLPPFDNSSMDGYAVRYDDVRGASESDPVLLPVVGDIAAGSEAAYRVQPGLCARIMTGAPIPAGADAVVPVEWTDGGVATVAITRAPELGAHIRALGDDVSRGELLLTTGTRVGATQVGLLAGVGRHRVLVRPRPRVVVLSTGSELVEPGQETGPGKINDSNSFMLTSAAREAGAQAYRVGIVPDDPKALMSTIEDQLVRADLVVTSGGVSVGAYDVVKEVLSRLGTVRFDRLAMQPGMPQGYGTIGPDSTPILTLPGNPVSSYVSFEVFVHPVIRRMLGVLPLHRPRVTARCTETFPSPAGKRQFARGVLTTEDGKHSVTPIGGAGSHLVGDLAHANGLIVVPEAVTEVPAGGTVDVILLERRMS